MRKLKFMIALLMALTMVMAIPAVAFAEDFEDKNAACSYDGSEISSNFDSADLATLMSNLEPGDTLEYEVKYTNNSGKTTEWYMLNDALETLEENGDAAKNGGYTYVLKNIGPNGTETVIFDNSKVGGEGTKGGLVGLKQATNATKDYFYIQRLKPGQSGKTSLTVALDGETQANDYMDTKAVIRLAYAVEEITPANPDNPDKPDASTVKTGDTFGLMKGLLLMTLALVLGILAFVSRKIDRRDGDEA